MIPGLSVVTNDVANDKEEFSFFVKEDIQTQLLVVICFGLSMYLQMINCNETGITILDEKREGQYCIASSSPAFPKSS
jgi:hypothetical protein